MKNFFWRHAAKLLARPAVTDWLIRRAMRTPYTPIVKNGELYMERYWLFNPYPDTGASGGDRKPWKFPISIRLHRILLPDQDRHMHDHPWNARTVILRGCYAELRAADVNGHIRLTGETVTLKFGEYHRVTAIGGDVWTMFITGPYQGTWGFLVDGVKVQWRKYLGLED